MADRKRPATRSVTKALKGEKDSSFPPPKKKQRIREVRKLDATERHPDEINSRQKEDQKKTPLPQSTKQSFLISKGEASYQVKTTETFKMKLRKVKSEMPSCSLCMLDSGDILIADSENPVLKQFNGDTYKIRFFLALPSTSHSVCKFNGTEAIVALSNQSIQFVSTQNELVATRTLSMDHCCLGVCVISDNIYITDGKNRNVFVYDMNGNIRKKIYGESIFSWNRFMAESDDGSAFYVTDGREGLIKMSRNGEVIWKCSDTSLVTAYAVCTDGLGSIFVSGASGTVVQISSNGQVIDEIIPSGSKRVTGLCFDKQKSKLFVARYYKCEDIYVYGFK